MTQLPAGLLAFLLLGALAPISAQDLNCQPISQIPAECSHLLTGDGPAREWLERRFRDSGPWYNISLTDATLYQTGLENHHRLGNALSPYWFARAVAHLASLNYQMLPVPSTFAEGDWFSSSHFVRYLPTFVRRSACPDLENLKRTCQEAHGYGLQYPHEVTHGWAMLHDTIAADIQSAVSQWAAATNFVMPVFEAGDVVIQDRCDVHTLISHWKYGPPAFRYYDGLNGTTAANIWLIRDPRPTYLNNRVFYPCVVLHAALCAHLSKIAPVATLRHFDHHDVDTDLARMLRAPVLYKGVSTLSMWAGIANRAAGARVFSMPLFVNTPDVATTPDLGAHWNWVNVPILNLSIAQQLPWPPVTYNDVDRILQWLMRT